MTTQNASSFQFASKTWTRLACPTVSEIKATLSQALRDSSESTNCLADAATKAQIEVVSGGDFALAYIELYSESSKGQMAVLRSTLIRAGKAAKAQGYVDVVHSFKKDKTTRLGHRYQAVGTKTPAVEASLKAWLKAFADLENATQSLPIDADERKALREMAANRYTRGLRIETLDCEWRVSGIAVPADDADESDESDEG